jgi:hypothetical protein
LSLKLERKFHLFIEAAEKEIWHRTVIQMTQSALTCEKIVQEVHLTNDNRNDIQRTLLLLIL